MPGVEADPSADLAIMAARLAREVCPSEALTFAETYLTDLHSIESLSDMMPPVVV